ncbi:MAG: DUF1028 domain-containing protein [Asgard group archaeon]|nr:DUF1028 domain-containing protein [Asgard group archaeon]
MTFSIIAYDKKANEVGFAIASCCWNSGVVCHAEVGKGVIAHQAAGSTKYHSVFFEQLDAKKTLAEIIDHFRIIDEHIESRQIGMINVQEDAVLSFTGEHCSIWAGHKTGLFYACQGNILVGPEVIDNMASAFESTDGCLTEKLYAALLAGDEAGGDARGKQSAKLCVKKLIESEPNVSVELVDFTIKDHNDPVKEIGRQLDVLLNYQKIKEIYSEFPQAQTEKEQREIIVKVHELLKNKKEYRYLSSWKDLAYFYNSIGDLNEAIQCFKIILEISPNFAVTLKSDMKVFGFSDSFVQRVFENNSNYK